MSKLQKVAAALLIALLLATAYGLWVTNPAPVQTVRRAQAPGSSGAEPADSAIPVIDQNTLLTARRLARLAHTPEEQSLAQAAVQIADHELDLAFTAALVHLQAHPPPLSADASQIQDRLNEAQKTLATDTESAKQLTRELAQAAEADKPAIQDRLDLAQSRVELAQDEVTEANEDLLEAGGNVHQRIQRMQQEHEAAEHLETRSATVPSTGALSSLRGMVGATREWLALREKRHWLGAAQRQVALSATQLAAERQQMVADLAASKAGVPELASRGQHRPNNAAGAAPRPAPAVPPGAGSGTRNKASAAAPPAEPSPAPSSGSLLGVTRQIAADQHRLTLRDQRITARRRLADIYAQWDGLVASEQRAVSHRCLQSAAIVLAALLLLLFADRWLERLLGRARIDRRQLATLRSVVGVALQIVAVAVILLMLVGVPGQLGAILGLVGAGLTVALKDFIVAFLGWFVLMGRNGMRLGDWVEINGVSGEVVELNMFHTVLLETGNWTDAGHPTGRRVTFTNSFAISGHYFNFSTSGQWLWDELSLMVPYDRDPHAVAEAIQKEVTAATAKDASQAEQEWRRASRGQRAVGFTAQPGIAVRPAAGGVEIAVRYVTRASERLALRARLYQSAVQLLAVPTVHA
ncbi:MAG TPA: mechanosensitive ion channel domain-containing protein [Steroidobacteraceae bacterium]|nr:mechanosensitive ion channel domain-containing protein [Steroidobacteraceae bacterium]